MAFLALASHYFFKLLVQHNIGTIVSFVLSLIILKLLFWNHTKKTFPPGPWGVPILGFLPFLGGQALHKTLFNLSKRYGPVLSLGLGCKSIVILSKQELIKDAFWKDELTGRPNGKTYDMFQGFGVINVTGDRWKKQRKFLCSRLRTMGAKALGPGIEILEEKIKSEINIMLEKINALNGQPVYVEGLLNMASANIVFGIMMSERFEDDDPIFRRIMQLHREGFKLFMKADLTSYLPVAKHFSGIKECMKTIKDNKTESMSILGRFLQRKRDNFDPDNVRDILDAYLLEEHLDSKDGKASEFGNDLDQQLIQIMSDLFSAGEETVKECVRWSLLIFLHQREVLEKVQKEMDIVIGRSRMPSLRDRPSLPYTEATINEVLRRETVVPLGTPHACTQDIKIDGFHIPKGTTVFSNIFSCHMDPTVWEEPDKFMPERFINSDGKCFKPKGFLPFGVGKRMCLGETLARNEIFLFISSILHTFELETAGDLPSMEGEGGVTNAPKPYKLRFIKRHLENPQEGMIPKI